MRFKTLTGDAEAPQGRVARQRKGIDHFDCFVFLGLNGYLFGRTYFEVVALRRLDRGTAKAVRRHFAGRVFIGGLMITGLFSLPLVNLIAPVIATAFMVHVFESLRRLQPRALLS